MLKVLGHGAKACDGLSRRTLLKAGLLSLAAATGKAAADSPTRQQDRSHGRVRSVVLLDLYGGPSHLDTFDPKPDAPAEIRGVLA